MALKRKIIIGIIGLVLICSPLAASYAAVQVDDRPRFIGAKIDGIDITPTDNYPTQLHKTREITLLINPIVDTINNYGYVGSITVRLWWKHSSGAYMAEPEQIFASTESATDVLHPDFTIGPMDEDWPHNLGAGQIYWYAELEVSLSKFDYYASPQSPITSIYFVEGVTTTQAPIQPPTQAQDPFVGVLGDIFGEEFAQGLSEGFASIGGNPVLILLVIAIGGVITFLIVSGRRSQSKQRGAATRRKSNRKSKKQSKTSIQSLTRRFKR